MPPKNISEIEKTRSELQSDKEGQTQKQKITESQTENRREMQEYAATREKARENQPARPYSRPTYHQFNNQERQMRHWLRPAYHRSDEKRQTQKQKIAESQTENRNKMKEDALTLMAQASAILREFINQQNGHKKQVGESREQKETSSPASNSSAESPQTEIDRLPEYRRSGGWDTDRGENYNPEGKKKPASGRPKAAPSPISQPKPAQPKPLPQSQTLYPITYSKLKKMYKEPYELAPATDNKNFPDYTRSSSSAKERGRKIHEALFHYVQSGKAIGPFRNREAIKKAGDFVKQRIGFCADAAILLEHKIILNNSLSPKQNGDKAYLTSIADAAILTNGTGYLFDYKTGASRGDYLELRLQALCIFSEFPEIWQLKARFLYVDNSAYMRGNEIIIERDSALKDIKPLLERYEKERLITETYHIS